MDTQDTSASKRFVQNVRYAMATEQAEHRGEIEHNCGVSRGYFARAQYYATKSISLDVAIKTAQRLGYTVEQLCSTDFIKQRQIAEIDTKIADLQDKREALG